MKVGTGGNLGLSREYHKKLFGPLFYPWWNCPLTRAAWWKAVHNLSGILWQCNIEVLLHSTLIVTHDRTGNWENHYSEPVFCGISEMGRKGVGLCS